MATKITAAPKVEKPKVARRAETPGPETYSLQLTQNSVIMIWNLTEGATFKGGDIADALASLRTKLRPLVEAISKKK